MFFMTVASPAPQDGALLDSCIARIVAGEQEALSQLYDKVRPAVYGFALSILKNAHDAEDVLQDTLLQVWQAAGSYHSHGKAMAWVMTITRNLSYDRLRQRARTESLGDEDWLEQLADRPAVTHEDRLTLAALLESLSAEEQQIVTLHGGAVAVTSAPGHGTTFTVTLPEHHGKEES